MNRDFANIFIGEFGNFTADTWGLFYESSAGEDVTRDRLCIEQRIFGDVIMDRF